MVARSGGSVSRPIVPLSKVVDCARSCVDGRTYGPGTSASAGALPSFRDRHRGADAQDDRGLQRPEPGVASALLRVAGHLLPGPRRRRWRDDGASFPRHHQPNRRSDRAGAHGAGHHPFHGQGLRCPSQSRREHRLRPAGRLPLATGAGVHSRPTRRRSPGGLVPPGRHPRLGHVRLELPGGRSTPGWTPS